MPCPGKVVQLAPGVHWVGVEDWYRRSFDAVMDLPFGSSYNAFLVQGKDKSALIDTVHRPFCEEFLGKLRRLIDLSRLDFVVMNHAEPDHSGCIPAILEAAPGAKLLASEKGIEMARSYYHIDDGRLAAVADNSLLDLGGKTLKFIYSPWLHWPETMFTFLAEERILFTCDFFGAHLASDRLFAEEVSALVVNEAKLYYAVIMMPYAKMAANGLDRSLALQPAVVAPSHGPVWRDPAEIFKAYESWIRGKLLPKAIVAYATMWGSTKKLADAAAASLSDNGIETVPFDLAVTDLAKLARDMVDSSAVLVGSPTVLGSVHPLAGNALTMLKMIRPRAKIGAILGSFGWSGGAAAQVKTVFDALKIETLDTLDVKGTPLPADLDRASELGSKVADSIRAGLA
ncbi:MAG: FprA family A-type flavoprotein [Chloroflexi bacterium]|nr:FprA family A-type flavoprotein [Chloroflexota bacterium]